MIWKEKLIEINKNGSKIDKKISKGLLDYRELVEQGDLDFFSRIGDLMDLFEVSYSTIVRFVRKIGYPTFKHFLTEFNDLTNQPIYDDGKHNYFDFYYKAAQVISKQLRDEIYILTSKRARSVGKLLNERLTDGFIKNTLFEGNYDDIDKFVYSSKRHTLFLISLSGHSKIFSEALHQVSKLPDEEKPNVIIITAAKWIEVFDECKFISIGLIQNRKYDVDSWKDYNYCLIDMITMLLFIINFIDTSKIKINKHFPEIPQHLNK